jgi:Tol biopolymer transport system component
MVSKLEPLFYPEMHTPWRFYPVATHRASERPVRAHGAHRPGSVLRAVTGLSVLCMALLLLGCDAGDVDEGEWWIGPVFMNTVDTYPAWSPDGHTIAYTHFPQSPETWSLADGAQIWLLDVETLERRYLTWGWYPAWSPDGTHIAFVRGAYSHAAIFVVEVATGDVRQVSGWGWNFFPGWSADGQKIAYGTRGDVEEQGLWVVRLDGGGGRRVSGGRYPGGIHHMPAWSPVQPDVMVHVREVTDSQHPHLHPQLFLMDSTGANVRRIGHIARRTTYPSWSPDARRIAFNSHPLAGDEGWPGIGIINADGSGFRELDVPGGFPSWGPDGHTLVYYHAFEELDGCTYRTPQGTLWTMNVDGTNRRPLTRPEDYRETECSD